MISGVPEIHECTVPFVSIGLEGMDLRILNSLQTHIFKLGTIFKPDSVMHHEQHQRFDKSNTRHSHRSREKSHLAKLPQQKTQPLI